MHKWLMDLWENMQWLVVVVVWVVILALIAFVALCCLVVVDFVIDYVFGVSILDYVKSWF